MINQMFHVKHLLFQLWYNTAMNFKKDPKDFNPIGDNQLDRLVDFKPFNQIQDPFVISTLETYAGLMLDYNRKVNIISRKITSLGLNQLLNESLILSDHITGDTIIDAGSGNGILGIPISFLEPFQQKKIVLVEPRQKKSDFLKFVKKEMELKNVEVICSSIEEYLKRIRFRTKKPNHFRIVIARGFPNLVVFCEFLKKKLINEVVLITSENKIKKNQIQLESVEKKIYNIPLRTELRILKLRPTEKTTRGRNDDKNM